MKYWEAIADNLSKAGWSWGCVSAVDSNGRTIWIADVHRDDGKRYVVRADDRLTAFLELERVTCESLRFLNAERFGTILAMTPLLSDSSRVGERIRRNNSIHFSSGVWQAQSRAGVYAEASAIVYTLGQSRGVTAIAKIADGLVLLRM